MNDLMTKSFLSYVELKKQALDRSQEHDIEIGPSHEQNLSKFFEEVAAIKTDMEVITNLLLDLQDLNEQTKSTQSAKVLRGLRDRIKSDMVSVLRKAKNIKTRLCSLDESNVANRSTLAAYEEGSTVDRTTTSVTNGLRLKLRDIMIDFQFLRDRIVRDHKEGLKKRYYIATGEEASEEAIEKMILEGGEVKVFEGKADLAMENLERSEALKEIQKSLTELFRVFLDMAVLVETQGEEVNDIERNVVRAGDRISGGTNELFYARQLKKRRDWTTWIGSFLLFVLIVCLLSTLVS